MPSAPTLSGPITVTLDDKYTARHGRVLISGIQAIVRMILEQRRLDTARGLNTRAFVSGYQGSPLAGLDQEMARARSFLDDAGAFVDDRLRRTADVPAHLGIGDETVRGENHRASRPARGEVTTIAAAVIAAETPACTVDAPRISCW